MSETSEKSSMEELKKQLEKRFFNGREVEALQSTKDMWEFISTNFIPREEVGGLRKFIEDESGKSGRKEILTELDGILEKDKNE